MTSINQPIVFLQGLHVQYLSVSGNIGSGKSTLLKGLLEFLGGYPNYKVHFIPEYLDDPDTGHEGHQMLSGWISGDICHKDFEMYIIDHYRRKLLSAYESIHSDTYGRRHLVVFERLPLEITEIFLPRTESCWEYIRDEVLKLQDEFGLSTFKRPSSEGTMVRVLDATKTKDEVLEEASKVLFKTLLKPKEPVNCLVFYLKAEIKCLLERIKKRARTSEDSYDVKYISELNERYHNLFNNYV